MKMPSLEFNVEDGLNVLPIAITFGFLGFLGRSVTLVNLLASLGVALIAMAFGCNLLITSTICALALLFLTYHLPEGFTSKSPTEVSARVKKLKEGFSEKEEEEFMNKDDEEEGFMNKVFQNITTAGYTSPGFGMGAPLVEGFEDEKKPETKSKPAPVEKKQEMAMPFKLGEIPSQVKNGPHIDASSTLMKAINSLNPDQINAMTNDTKQLIETQKSLMGMLGTMKPMMNDGKELMETFQEMFGKQ